MPKGSVLITGCSEGGIGHGLAEAFVSRGYHVYATARNVSKIGEALTSHPNVRALELDVTKSEQIQEVLKTIEAEGKGLDFLVNNAGRNHFMPILDEDIEDAKKIFETNFWGPLAMLKAFAPLLIKSKGHITSITSTSGHVNVPYMGLYAGSKQSLELATDTLRLELEPFGVGVLSIVTGAVQTNGQTYFEDWKLPEDSLYKSIEKTIASRAQGHDGFKRMPLKDYASSVVDQITRRATGKYWLGIAAATVKWGVPLTPQSLLDRGLKQGTGLDVLARELQQGKET